MTECNPCLSPKDIAAVDDTYNPCFMEKEGIYENFLRALNFNYYHLDKELFPPVIMYNKRGACLHHGVTGMLKTAMECVEEVDGMDYEFFKRIRVNSNQCAMNNMIARADFGGSSWSNINVEEMVYFLDVLLWMVLMTDN